MHALQEIKNLIYVSPYQTCCGARNCRCCQHKKEVLVLTCHDKILNNCFIIVCEQAALSFAGSSPQSQSSRRLQLLPPRVIYRLSPNRAGIYPSQPKKYSNLPGVRRPIRSQPLLLLLRRWWQRSADLCLTYKLVSLQTDCLKID